MFEFDVVAVLYCRVLTGMLRLANVSSTPTNSSPPGMSSRDRSIFSNTFDTQQVQQIDTATQ